jgi:hypothetical protein
MLPAKPGKEEQNVKKEKRKYTCIAASLITHAEKDLERG